MPAPAQHSRGELPHGHVFHVRPCIAVPLVTKPRRQCAAHHHRIPTLCSGLGLGSRVCQCYRDAAPTAQRSTTAQACVGSSRVPHGLQHPRDTSRVNTKLTCATSVLQLSCGISQHVLRARTLTRRDDCLRARYASHRSSPRVSAARRA